MKLYDLSSHQKWDFFKGSWWGKGIDVSHISTRCALHSVIVLKTKTVSMNINTYAFWTLYISINDTLLLRELVTMLQRFTCDCNRISLIATLETPEIELESPGC